MAFIGGDIEEIVCKHSTGTYRFQSKSEESFTINPGGFKSNDDDGGVSGGGVFIDQINRKRWSVEGSILVDMKSENESKNIPLLSKSPELGVWTFTLANGVVYKGKGKPVGDFNFDSNTTQMSIKFSGGGILEPIK